MRTLSACTFAVCIALRATTRLLAQRRESVGITLCVWGLEVWSSGGSRCTSSHYMRRAQKGGFKGTSSPPTRNAARPAMDSCAARGQNGVSRGVQASEAVSTRTPRRRAGWQRVSGMQVCSTRLECADVRCERLGGIRDAGIIDQGCTGCEGRDCFRGAAFAAG
jgi:hypothetical protein